MTFKKLTVNGVCYGDTYSDRRQLGNVNTSVTNVDFADKRFLDDMRGNGRQSDTIQSLLRSMALCHEIAVQTKNNATVYNASSPDELALVNFAKFCGYELIDVTSDN